MTKPTPTRVRIDITQDDIERARRNDSHLCVVAQAIARAVPGATRIDVDTQTIRFTVDNERRIHLTPYVVAGYVIAFDAGDPIKPFSFQLRDPKRVARQTYTKAGKASERVRSVRRRAKREDAASTVTRPTSVDDHAALVSAVTAPTPDAVEQGRPAIVAATEPTQDEREGSATAAYDETQAQKTISDGGGRKAPPRVFRKKQRSYGHRLLRINSEEART